MVLKQKLTILNKSPKCEGNWTRIEGETKTILNSVTDEDTLISMKIDEDKIITPYTITGERMVSSDHCAIIATFNWLIEDKKKAKEEVNTLNTSKKNLEKFTRMTSGTRLRSAVKEGGIQERYNAWEKEMEQIISNCFCTKKRKKHQRGHQKSEK